MDQIGHKVCDGESTNYGVTSEAARKDKKKKTPPKKKKKEQDHFECTEAKMH